MKKPSENMDMLLLHWLLNRLPQAELVAILPLAMTGNPEVASMYRRALAHRGLAIVRTIDDRQAKPFLLTIIAPWEPDRGIIDQAQTTDQKEWEAFGEDIPELDPGDPPDIVPGEGITQYHIQLTSASDHAWAKAVQIYPMPVDARPPQEAKSILYLISTTGEQLGWIQNTRERHKRRPANIEDEPMEGQFYLIRVGEKWERYICQKILTLENDGGWMIELEPWTA